MYLDRYKYVFPIAFTYIGTVVGAGFASGQEIMHFFTRFGIIGKVGIVCALILFAALGNQLMILGARLNAPSYKEVNEYLFGKAISKWINALMVVMLIGVAGAMIAGIGAIFAEQLHLSSMIGMLLTVFLGIWITMKGMEGIFSINTLFVPVMMLFMLWIVLHSWLRIDSPAVANMYVEYSWGQMLFSAITYVSYNLVLAQAILVPIGYEVKDEKAIKLGGYIGALILGLLIFATDYVIGLRGEKVFSLNIPMAEVIADMGHWIKGLFLVVISIEIFTTFIANIFGLAKRLSGWLSLQMQHWLWVISFVALLLAQIGFQNFITRIYPLFGYCGFLLMIMLFVRKWDKSNTIE